mgnify:FL=1
MDEKVSYLEIRKAIANAFIGNEKEALGSLEPALLYNDKEGNVKVLNALQDELLKCLSFSMSVAFITKGGYQLFKETFKTLKEKGIRGRILTTDYLSFTDPSALLDIQENFPNIEVRIFKTNNEPFGFHTKGYIFEEKGSEGNYFKAIIGSSNLTDKALTTNKEWNTSLTSTKDGAFLKTLLFQFNELWDKATLLKDYIEQYKKIYDENKKAISLTTIPSREIEILSPNPMQIAFTKSLSESVKRGDRRGLLISATGTGKTYASAFGIREINPKRVLFLAHRALLLSQGILSYKRVMGKEKRFLLFTGESKERNIEKADFVFATSELLGKEDILEAIPKNSFDFIVIDEVHKAASPTYQRIINHFEPKYLLGMTATPERTDDANAIFSLFHHNILYEIRLKDALELDLLCPFHYYGVTDLKGINDETYDKKDFAKLYSEERINFIIQESRFYGYDGTRLKGLVFVSREEDGALLSRKLNERGYKTRFLSGKDKTTEREEAIRLLEKDDNADGSYLDFIITIDIFNEGVDIPSINQVLLLRPTESSIIFIQQLGRGLRKSPTKHFVNIIDFIGNYDTNFMIPKAFSYNGDKEAARKVLVHGGNLPGISTVEFDEIAKERIFHAIAKTSFSTKEEFKTAVLSLANKLHRLPSYQDFLSYTDFEPNRIIEKYGSYPAFLKTIEKTLPRFITLPLFSKFELSILDVIGNALGGGIRVEEPLLLLSLIEGKNLKEFEEDLFKTYGKIIEPLKWNTIKKVFEGKWDPYYSLAITQGNFELVEAFRKALQTNKRFFQEVRSLLLYEIDRANRLFFPLYEGTDLSLFKQYSYKEVCLGLNYEKNLTAVIGGYKFDKRTNTFPIFVNYDKDPNLESSTNYFDKFINERLFSWESKKKRHLDSREFDPLLRPSSPQAQIYLFVRKANKDKDNDAKKFFFLGKIKPIGEAKEVLREVEEKGQKKPLSYVDINFLLEKEVRKDIYDYLTANIKEREE